MDKPLITTGVDVTVDTQTVLKAIGLIIATAILFGVVATLTKRVMG